MIELENQESIYKALLKINQIGKKLSTNSKYILSNGILLAYTEQEMADIEANPVSIGIVETSLYKKIEGIGDLIGIIINGDELYKLSQEYEFDSIEINSDNIQINFIYYAIDDNKYINNFKEILLKKGFSDDEIKIASVSNYTSNMDMYDLFLDYKKKYQPIKEKCLCNIKLYFVKTNNKIFKKCDKIIDLLLNSLQIYHEEINRDILDIIITSSQPVIRTLYSDDNNRIKVRLMKSLFNPIAKKNDASIFINKKDDKYFLITQIDMTGVKVFNIYQIVVY